MMKFYNTCYNMDYLEDIMLTEKNKPDTKRQILYDSTFWMYLCQIEAESSIVVARGWG